MPFRIKNGVSLPEIPKSALSNVVTKIQQGDEAGETYQFTKASAVPGNTAELVAYNEETVDVRILVPHFYPSIHPGLSAAAVSNPLSQSLEMLYNAVVGSAYDTTNFNRADLGKHNIISEGFLCAIDMIDRYLDTFNINDYGNLAPQCLRRAQGFRNTHNNDPLSFTDIVSARNELVPLFNKLLVPSSIPWLQKHRYLVRHVFADDEHMKSAFIVPRIHVLYTRIGGSGNNVMIADPNYYNPGSNLNDLIDFIEYIKACLNEYIDSAFYKELSPYLWRAMIQSNGPKIDKPYTITEYSKVQPLSTIDVLFDYRVIQMIRNADYIGTPYNLKGNNGSNAADMSIYEDNSMNLRQGKIGANGTNRFGIAVQPILRRKVTTGTPAMVLINMTFDDFCNPVNRADEGSLIVPYIAKTRTVNAEGWPSSDEALYYTMNCKVVVDAYPSSYTGTECFLITYCGDTTFMYLETYSLDPTVPGSITYYEVMPFETNLRANSFAGTYTDVNDNMVYYNSSAGFKYKVLITSFLCCPVITHIFKEFNNNNLIYLTDQYIDKDNIVSFSTNVLRKLHAFTMYDAMLCRTLKLNSSSSDRDSQGSGKGKKPDKA